MPSLEIKWVSVSIVFLIVSRSLLLWADGGNGIHISLPCIFNGFHSLYIKNKISSGLVGAALRLHYSPPLTLPSDIMAEDIWHRAEMGRFDY